MECIRRESPLCLKDFSYFYREDLDVYSNEDLDKLRLAEDYDYCLWAVDDFFHDIGGSLDSLTLSFSRFESAYSRLSITTPESSY